ncbi:MAG: helix-turn-helix domain-containing protein [Oscillospiraceae bacterium]|nr:helix-turn-helix domain-containing protein [Oscillospiraceae bacterium]
MQTYTLKELQPILKRTPKTIKKYIKDGALDASIINQRYIITEENVKDFLDFFQKEV